MGKIISIVNRKGGVGKTTLALGLADTLIAETEKPYRPDVPVVVTVDLDPQGSLTRALLYDRDEKSKQERLKEALAKKYTFAAILRDRLGPSLSDTKDVLIHGVGPIGKHYPVLANEATAWDAERWALKAFGEDALKEAVRNILRDLAAIYRFVIVDAPPGQTVTAEAAILESDLVLCPTSPDLLSLWGLESFDNYLKELCSVGGPPARFVFTKFKDRVPSYDPQNRVHEEVYAFTHPKHYITLLREAGKQARGRDPSINLPFDPKLVARLEGAPNPGRLWPWAKMYTPTTQRALLRLVSAVKKELNSGEPCRPISSPRTVNRGNAHAAG